MCVFVQKKKVCKSISALFTRLDYASSIDAYDFSGLCSSAEAPRRRSSRNLFCLVCARVLATKASASASASATASTAGAAQKCGEVATRSYHGR